MGIEDRGHAVESDALRALLDPKAAGIEVSGANEDGEGSFRHSLLALRPTYTIAYFTSRHLLSQVGKFDVVSITPPYEEVVYSQLLDAVCSSPAVGEDTIVIVEYPVELGCLPHVIRAEEGGEGASTLVGVRNRRYGRTVVAIYIADSSGR